MVLLKFFNVMNIFSDDHLPLLKEAIDNGVDFNVPCLPDNFPIHFAIFVKHFQALIPSIQKNFFHNNRIRSIKYKIIYVKLRIYRKIIINQSKKSKV